MTRRDLYDLVWSKPLDALAVDLGISDRGLAKVCASHSVPLPPQGYWLLKKKPARPALPTLRRSKGPVFIERRPVVPPQHRLRREARKTPLADPPGYIASAKAHRWVRASVSELRRLNQTPERAIAVGEGLCGVSCRRVDTYRAVRLLDGLARALKARGLELRPADDRMRVAFGNDAIEVRLHGGEDGYFALWIVNASRKWRDTEEALIERLIPRIAVELEVIVRDRAARNPILQRMQAAEEESARRAAEYLERERKLSRVAATLDGLGGDARAATAIDEWLASARPTLPEAVVAVIEAVRIYLDPAGRSERS